MKNVIVSRSRIGESTLSRNGSWISQRLSIVRVA